MAKRLELLLGAVDGCNVPDPTAPDGGPVRFIGKVYDEPSGAFKVGAPQKLVLISPSLPDHRAFLAKCARLGQLTAENAETAAALGVSAPKKPAMGGGKS